MNLSNFYDKVVLVLLIKINDKFQNAINPQDDKGAKTLEFVEIFFFSVKLFFNLFTSDQHFISGANVLVYTWIVKVCVA